MLVKATMVAKKKKKERKVITMFVSLNNLWHVLLKIKFLPCRIEEIEEKKEKLFINGIFARD